ncbi:DUF6122 family protein [Lacibacter cauensis]|nr:DUF6122 family protein [Lacibacter cauensis]
MQYAIHYFLHLIFPIVLAFFIDKNHWLRVYLILLATMLVDLDHLFATPLYNPCRCSIGFHPLHSYLAIGGYALLLIPKKTRIPAIGLLLHMLADSIDCLFIRQVCP